MKWWAILISLIILSAGSGQAQNKYSTESLEKASQEELDIYLDKAQKLQKTGKILNIIGGASYGAVAVAAVLGSDWGFGVDSWALIGIAGGGIILGTASLGTGIPSNITGKRRAERIRDIQDQRRLELEMDWRACLQYDPGLQQYQPGLGLLIRF